MGWTITLENESRKPVKTLSGEFTTSVDLENTCFKLLRYLDPYGDTTFSRVQMDDLIADLQILRMKENTILLKELELLAMQCRGEQHTYLAFYGD